jgi:hypothetical protein
MLAAPVAVPVSMTAVFALLRRRLSRRAAYTAGFAVYWAGWCVAFPMWVLGPDGVVRVLRSGRWPGRLDVALLAFPVIGAVGAELWPQRRLVDRRTAAVMIGTAAVNAVGEELLWRGTFLAQFRGDVSRGAVWPLTGFTVWHLAPQLILPSSRGRAGFLLVPPSWAPPARRPPGVPAACGTSCCPTCSPTPAGWGPPASGSAADRPGGAVRRTRGAGRSRWSAGRGDGVTAAAWRPTRERSAATELRARGHGRPPGR